MKINTEKIKEKKSVKELLEFSMINIDKSSGPTSFDVSDFVRKTLGLRKTSHFGTLDPKVTGVLPVALNRACKLTGFFLGEDKTYVGIARFHEEVSKEKVEEAIKNKFLGKIEQVPPVKSRVKRQLREREVYSFEILEKEGKDFLFITKVQGGTYIRKLIDDLGKELGIGAHMLELRRTNAGIFFEDDENYPSVNLYEFEKAVEDYKKGNEEPLRKILIPGEIVSELFPIIEIKEECVKRIFKGSPIHIDEVADEKSLEYDIGEKLVVFSSSGEFVGIFRVIKEERLFARSEFTFQPLQ